MILKFTRDFDFYRNNDASPYLSFAKEEMITIICDTQEDPYNYADKPFVLGNRLLQHSSLAQNNFWVNAKNGITVWTSIGALLKAGILSEVG